MGATRLGTTRVGRATAPPRVRVGADPELERFGKSLERSRVRRRGRIFTRRRRRRRWVWVAAGALVLAGAAALGPLVVERDRAPVAGIGEAERPPGRSGTASAAPAGAVTVPEAGAIERAIDYARDRGGLVSIAVIDSRGEMHGLDRSHAYLSASMSKALLLAAELRRLQAAGAPLDDATRALLTRMITVSDNDAADAIYYRVGDAGLADVAADAGMEDLGVAGYWANVSVTAADMAHFMWRLGDVLSGPHREFAMRLLGGIAPSQRWGIPAGAGDEWSVRFKGGWRPTESGSLVHQAAELTGHGERLAIAVLSDAQPSHEHGAETLRGIADRLVGPMSREPWDGRWN